MASLEKDGRRTLDLEKDMYTTHLRRIIRFKLFLIFCQSNHGVLPQRLSLLHQHGAKCWCQAHEQRATSIQESTDGTIWMSALDSLKLMKALSNLANQYGYDVLL